MKKAFSECFLARATLMNSEKVNSQYFNLAGQRIAQPTKGLYIVNGKTYLVK